MDGITELAMLFKQRENNRDYSPMFGTILEVESLKIKVGEKIILESSQITSCITLVDNEESSDIGREVILLPYSDDQKFILIGVVN